MDSAKYPILLERHASNPILTANDWPYPVHSVFNPGATRLPDGSTLLLCRAEDRAGRSHFSAARSKNGIDSWEIDPKPTLESDPFNHPEELWGIEDPRITYVAELEQYVIAYTAFGRPGPGVALATTSDFKHFHRLGLMMQADDKDAALLPRRFGGEFALLHRPASEAGAHIWLSFSPDLVNWGGHVVLLAARRGCYWDANKIGLGPPLIETEAGWLMMYHGVRHHASGSIYRLGLALLDKENPSVCLRRGGEWMFGPEEEYEILGDVPYVVFPCGHTVAEDGDTLMMYYGSADTSICLATGSIKKMLDWLSREEFDATIPAPAPGG
jgi:predicted GH43/DUF377 family glycosyl hydrolase